MLSIRALVLTCEQLDLGQRKNSFSTSSLSEYEFVEGVSKFNVDDHLGIMSNPFDYGFGNGAWDVAAAAIGYGHYKAWNKVIQYDEVCLILEDDVDLLPNIGVLKDYVENRKRYNELSILSLWKTGVYEYQGHNTAYHQVVNSYENSGALAYVLNPQTARYLVNRFKDIQEPVDHFILGANTLKSSEYVAYVTQHDVVAHKEGNSLRTLSHS